MVEADLLRFVMFYKIRLVFPNVDVCMFPPPIEKYEWIAQYASFSPERAVSSNMYSKFKIEPIFFARVSRGLKRSKSLGGGGGLLPYISYMDLCHGGTPWANTQGSRKTLSAGMHPSDANFHPYDITREYSRSSTIDVKSWECAPTHEGHSRWR